MRYLLQKENAAEQKRRLQFLFDVFKIWFVAVGTEESFFVFQSFPFSSWEPDVMLIYGHNYHILPYLMNGSVPEKYIYIISCMDADSNLISIPGKCIYYDSKSESTTNIMYGADFGFDFDITDAELNLYNSKLTNAKEKLNTVFYLSVPSCRKKEDSTWTNSLRSSHLTISSISLFLEQFICFFAKNYTT